MTDAPSTTPVGPIPEGERLGTLDLLRGFALLGIFMVNMQFFTMVFGEIVKPGVFDDAPLIDVLSWAFVKAFFEYKFISLFSLLFGAGMIMMMTRAQAKGRPFVRTYLRRMAVLAVIGLVHGFLLWYGDILFIYSIVGTALLLARKWRPRTLLITAGAIVTLFFVLQLTLGLVLVSMSSGDNGDVEAEPVASVVEQEQPAAPGETPSTDDAPDAPEEAADDEAEEAEPTWSEENAELAERYPWMVAMAESGFDFTSERWAEGETAAYKEGPYSHALAFRAFTYTAALVFAIPTYGWRVLATFLIGAALMKLGVFSSSAGRWHRRLFLAGLGIGVPLEMASAWFVYQAQAVDQGRGLIGTALREPGSLLMCLGFVGAAGMIVSAGVVPRLVRAISAVGRLALSNYLLQTVTTTFLMYHWGLGYFGDVPRPWQVVMTVVIYSLQIPLSMLWLRYFTIGPMEWIWRSLTYKKRQPMRRRRD